jgi:hypothetical protein
MQAIESSLGIGNGADVIHGKVLGSFNLLEYSAKTARHKGRGDRLKSY